MAIPLGQIRSTVYLLIGACTLLAASMPASAAVADPVDVKVCIPGADVCVLVGSKGGGVDACIMEDGGPIVGVSLQGEVLIYHPGPSGGAHTGYSSTC